MESSLEIRIIKELQKENFLHVCELARRLTVDKSTVSIISRELIRKKLLEAKWVGTVKLLKIKKRCAK